jgi:putative PIN family toxin of toxin-antitoxin system
MPDAVRIVVLDTNVLVSGLLSPLGPPAQVLALTIAGELIAAYDPRVLSEYRDVLRRPEFGFAKHRVRDVLDQLERDGLPVVPRPLRGRLPDPSDEPFLEVAAAAGAVVVTGNLRHFPSSRREGVLVLSPRELLDRLRAAPRQ